MMDDLKKSRITKNNCW